MRRVWGSLGETRANSDGGLDASQEGRAVDYHLESSSLLCRAAATCFMFDLGLFKNA